jgi:hypothetical protein
MKYKFLLVLGILVCISLPALSGCGLEDDITPPPGYALATSAESSQTPASSQTFQATNSTEENDVISAQKGLAPGATQETVTQNVNNSHTEGSDLTVTGIVTNASSSQIADALTAQLYLFNTSTNAIDQALSAEVHKTGQYQFDHVPAKSNTTYIVTIDYEGVTYPADPVTFNGTSTVLDIPVTVFDVTKDLDSLDFAQIHMQFDFSSEGQVQANILYIVNNQGQKTVIVQSDGTSIPFIQIPATASNVQYDLASGGAQLMRATNGFALLPGNDKQYGIIVSFTLPYSHNVDISQLFSLPVSSETIIVPEGVRVNSDQLDDLGTQDFQGVTYQLYQGGHIASGGTLALTISGKPSGSNNSSLSRQQLILIGVSVLGLILIGIGLFLFLRERRHQNQIEIEAGMNITEAAATRYNDRDSIMDAIIALDDQYKGGHISREAYQKRRDELKNSLRELI